MTFYTAQTKNSTRGKRKKRSDAKRQKPDAVDDDAVDVYSDAVDDDWCSCGSCCDSGDEWVLMTI